MSVGVGVGAHVSVAGGGGAEHKQNTLGTRTLACVL